MGTVLDKLSGARVLDIAQWVGHPPGTLTFVEGCDEYFNVALTREEVRALAEELRDLADSEPDVPREDPKGHDKPRLGGNEIRAMLEPYRRQDPTA